MSGGKRKRNVVTLDQKLKALERLSGGETIRRVSVWLGVGISTVKGWKRDRSSLLELSKISCGKRKRNVVTLDQKLKALERLDGGESIRSVSHWLGVESSTVRRWRHKRTSILENCSQFDSQEVLHNRRTFKKPINDLVDQALWLWFVKQRQVGTGIGIQALKEKASALHAEFGNGVTFEGNDSWVSRWRKRHGVYHLNDADMEIPSGDIKEEYATNDGGGPEGGKVNADHNHSRIAVEQEATVVLREIRERCLRELTKRPILIIRETLATCSQEVRDYLNIGAIRQDMRRMRSSAAGRELLKKPKHPIKRARMEASSLDPMTPLGDQTPFNHHGAGTGSDPNPNSRVEDTDQHSNKDTSTVKDELILDDYEDSEHTYYDESESSKSASEDNLACPSTSKDLSVPFETVICDSEVQQFQVKQEFVEEESSNFEAIQDTRSVLSTAMSTDVCSTVPTKVQPPCRPTSFADKMRLNSLNTLSRMSNTLDHPTISSQDINSLRYSVPCQPPVMPYNYEYNIAENSSASNYSKFYSTSTSVTNPTNLPSARSTSISGVSVPNVSATSATNSPVVSARNLNSVTSTNLLKENCSVNHYSKFYSRPTSVTNPADIYTNFQGVSATNPPATTSTDVPFTNPTNLPADSSTNLPVNVAVASASPPGQPPRDEDSSCIYDREDLEGVFISLKKVPKERRKKTKDKLLRLVKLITELGLDPDEVSFSVTTK